MPSTSPQRFATIDPGLRASGLALWNGNVLIDVRLVRVPAKLKDLTERINYQSEGLRAALALEGFEDCPVVSERMHHRHYRGNKVDPNDLIDLNLLSGRLGTYYVLPSAWKGTIPRDVEQVHSRHALFPFELERVEAVLPASLRKEAYSAVGIGLSILGRAHKCMGWVWP